MNWKEFKESVESNGVTDDMIVGDIIVMRPLVPSVLPMRVYIYKEGFAKSVYISL